jgi:hypothetical protein
MGFSLYSRLCRRRYHSADSMPKGDQMRLNSGDPVPSQSAERSPQENETQQNQMTPVRPAALDALEREFHDLLSA